MDGGPYGAGPCRRRRPAGPQLLVDVRVRLRVRLGRRRRRLWCGGGGPQRGRVRQGDDGHLREDDEAVHGEARRHAARVPGDAGAVRGRAHGALIAFLQRVGGGQGEPARLPPHGAGVVPPPPMPDCAPPSPRRHAAAASLQQLVPVPPKAVEALARAGGEGGGSTPSRWPKEEVEALIQMRNEKGEKYHDAGAKGPLWEDIAAAMRGIGYSRSAKRCKEKWENINKYYKKVKESNKRRPEDSKTCPYFHQLDAMYRNKHRSGTGGRTAPRTNMASAVAVAATVQDNPSKRELEGKSSNDADNRKNDEQGNVLTSPASGDTAPDGRGQCG
ncbi:Putative homeodomain-like transcription factor superfamily protein isoform 1 [Zea mays]|uniref:Putative homeodomain-like transcription factor superfamily protein isoform 1 n=1 Tax=Zea mays TaxID=4577 RepID=A0A1D6Q675_MAIZE|nr:Putative homeodomain-like transcription factor superfamily protein isoform 1 [Zea mays]